ncbi:MAG: hypothetical protein AAGA54_36465 [Myxococcota bacterium]
MSTAIATAALLFAWTPSPTATAVATSMRFAQPEADPSWGDDAEPAEEEAPAPTEEVAPEDANTDIVQAAEPLESTYPVQPTEPLAAAPKEIEIPKKQGIGLMATAGGLGAIGIGVMSWRMARIKRLCVADDVDVTTVSEDTIGDVTGAAADCFVSGVLGNAGLWTLQALPNATNWGIAPAAGIVRAKYDAARSVKNGDVQRKPGVFIGTGAALLGAGAIGRIIVAVTRLRSLNPTQGIAAGCLDGLETQVDEFFDCYANRNVLLYGMHQLSSSAIAAGGGLLAYGVVYKRERANLEKLQGDTAAKLELHVTPQLSLDYTGVTAQLRF